MTIGTDVEETETLALAEEEGTNGSLLEPGISIRKFLMKGGI